MGPDLHDLDRAAEAFRQIVDADPADAPAWFNRALCLAWKGANIAAIAAFEQVVNLEAGNPAGLAVEAWTLAEVLRFGAGAEPLADDLSYSASAEWQPHDPDPQTLGTLLATEPPIDPDLERPRLKDVHAYEWLDRPPPQASEGLELADLPRLLATVIRTPRSIRLAGPDLAALEEAQEKLAASLADSERPFRREARPLPLSLADAAVWTIRFPLGLDSDSRHRLARAAVEHFFDNVWIHIPRRGLDGLRPLEAGCAAAAGDRVLRAKLEGVVAFREQLGARSTTRALYGGYPFDRLRRRLGLEVHSPETVDAADLTCANGTELDQLVPGQLDEHRLAEAFESAGGLRDDARAARFAAELAARGPGAMRSAHVNLEQLCATRIRDYLARGDKAGALACLAQAVALDRELTGGSLERTLATWRAEVLVRAGAPDAALEAFQELLARHPGDADLAYDAASTLHDAGYSEQARPLAELALRLAQQAADPAFLRRALALYRDLPPTLGDAAP
jgi:tetratricopeptide (TPR) repeat protein